MLQRAGDLVTDNPNVQWQALSAAGIFGREGQREAAIGSLERLYNVTGDPELKENIAHKLDLLNEERREETTSALLKRHDEAFSRIWQHDLPFVSRAGMLVLGPPTDALQCAGERTVQRGCARSWADWWLTDSAR